MSTHEIIFMCLGFFALGGIASAVVTWACCIAAHRCDEDLERMLRERRDESEVFNSVK
jgi:hypothetical protein